MSIGQSGRPGSLKRLIAHAKRHDWVLIATRQAIAEPRAVHDPPGGAQ